MFINRVSRQLLSAPELVPLLHELGCGNDASLAVGQSARPLMIAAIWARDPRPCLVVVSGEEAADRTARALAAWLGQDVVARYPMRRDHPWAEAAPDDAVIGTRCRAIARLAAGEKCVVVASAPALLRRVPPAGSGYFASSTFSVGDEVPFEDVAPLLVGMGYTDVGDAEDVAAPGTFHVHGDSVDVFPAQATSPVRIEFFGDEIDRVRRMVPSTGQTIGELDSVDVVPCREMAFTNETIARAEKALYNRAQNDAKVAADLEAIQARSAQPALEKYLPMLYGGSASPIEHISKDALVVLAEPRALFDDCQRAMDDILASASSAHVSTEGLYTSPREMDFGRQQRLSLSSILRVGGSVTAELKVRQPNVAGADTKLIGVVRQLVNDNVSVVFAAPDRGARESLELRLTDEHIPFAESLGSAAENAVPVTSADANGAITPLRRGSVTFTDAPVPAGIVVPSAHLGVLSISDLTPRTARNRRRAKRVDPTSVTFPFKPGDYVVHATHGIALFSQIVRQEVAGRMRDYFLLEYAGGDKLYVPLEQVDRITRYVGPDGSSPRLTRLNTADWSRATGKARRSAKKLAFDLVDLYTRRASVTGYAFSPDTPAQLDMESSFPYELTPDQASAVADIKADMEARKPMDRLLCGDVGFGKTEVALRAAFKCCQDNKQVMVLCPTTILAEQHFETFFARFSPFDLDVRVLSRFVTPAQQRQALEGFAAGTVNVLIGTHRLLSADVNPHDLGLVIIDEEQRFGVQHKEQLKNMREQVDVLTLSATPIPRTLNMALSGIRDMSTIEEPPQDRIPVQTFVMEHDWNVLCDAMRRELQRGGQVFYLHNRIENIERTALRISKMLDGAVVDVAHGQMNEEQLSTVMERMVTGETQILVCTTIIETGIDIPNVNTLIIEDADRMGLAQLHQLRGRVGRSNRRASAYLTFRRGRELSEIAEKRLSAIREFAEFNSGFRIAMRDLEIRGAGSLLGAEQSGHMIDVGYDMYLKLLEEAVLEERGEKPEQRAECAADLAVSANIPESYVPSQEQRMDLYRRIALVRTEAEADDLMDEVIDRFGDPPPSVYTLVQVALLRADAGKVGVTDISQKNGCLKFLLAQFDMQKVSALYARPEFKGRLKVDAGAKPGVILRLKTRTHVIEQARAFVSAWADAQGDRA